MRGKRKKNVRTDLGSSSTSDDLIVLDRPLDDHNSIMQTSLYLRNELFRPTPQQKRTSHRLLTPLEKIESLSSNLLLLKRRTLTQMLRLNIRTRRLNRSSNCLNDSFEIIYRYSSSAKDISIGKVLRGEISNRESGENDFGARVGDGFEFGVDD